MKTVQVYKLLERKALVTRGTARSLQANVADAMSGQGQVVLDFSGVEALAPSFFDEILAVVEECARTNDAEPRVTIQNAPGNLSSGTRAVVRVHDMTLEESNGAWNLSKVG